MSGGTFDYNQYRIDDIAEEIENRLDRCGKEKPSEELWFDREHYLAFPEEKYYENYSEEVFRKLEEGAKILRIAAVYAHRIDWFLAGDDGEESFLKRLDDDLNKLESKIK